MFLSTARGGRRLARRAIVAGGAALAATLAFTACTGQAGGASSASSTLIAYTGQAGDYQINFNPYSPSSIGGLGTIFEPLFFQNKAKISDPVPLLGTESAFNADGTELSVTTRAGVKWTDG